MAFPMEGRLYVALYAISQEKDGSLDARNSEYVVSSMEGMEQYRKGIQLADENLPGHPGKFMEGSNYRRLDALRRKHDPEGRFCGYMRILLEFEVPHL